MDAAQGESDSSTDSSAATGYLSDAPLDNQEFDRFGRRPFANRIADTVAARTDPTSLVVGLYGKWGEGKTTVLNFIEERLAQSDTVICVRFNPWLYQGESQLLLSFFETLASAVGRSLATRTEDMGKWLRTLGRALGTVSVGVGVANLSPGNALETLGESLSSVDILEKRKQLEDLLTESGKRILILIDDIDRLDDSEIATVFKLVKLAADFKHTSYVLAFDQQVVAKALAKRYADSDESGTSFVEKIVQVPLDLPQAQISVLLEMTDESVSRVLGASDIVIDENDITRFSTLFQRYLAPHIGTPRMVRRLGNALEFTVPLLAGEVNVADLVLLEMVRVLFPGVYKMMPGVKNSLLGHPCDLSGNQANDFVRGQLEPLFAQLDAPATEHVQGILRELFPRIERLYTNYHYGPESIPGWRASQRICAPDYFDRFFSYGIPLGDVADADIRGFLDLLQTARREEIARSLHRLYGASSPLRIIQKLREGEASIEGWSAGALALAVADESSDLPDPHTSMTASRSGPFGQGAMLIAQLLRGVPSGERSDLVREVINSAPILPFASEVFRWARAISGESLAEDARALSQGQLAELDVLLAERVAREAEEAPLFNSLPRYAASLYYDWLRGAGQPVIQQHLVDSCAGNAENWLALVRSFLPTAWDLRTGAPITPPSIATFVERNTYDAVTGLIEPQVLMDLFAELYPRVRNEVVPDDVSELDEMEQVALRFAQIQRIIREQGPGVVGPDAAVDTPTGG